ncbi:MBL fold metallo-hydrolase [Sphingomonas sp.]|uniref:MBL fold metallo-hydrolase n=1 Tax=Sphingomonas sp. TaxID=28214 RepID=UPI00286D30EB|nr:MBL fold metallo-hydrolase [Sphingomonas sp.]
MHTLTFLGAAGTVTGSKYLLELGGRRLLVDCGLFQGPRDLRERNWQHLVVPASSIDAVVLTHAHLDHSGYLPRLVREGFAGPIYATGATSDVARLILLDSAHLQEKDAEFANRHGFSRHKPAMPLYSTKDAERALGQFQSVAWHDPLELGEGTSLLFRRAGHILGAATVELKMHGQTIVFSGDLGRFNDPIMVDPERVDHADYLIVESTYGDRIHPNVDPEAMLKDVIDRTVRRGGTVVIPSFAIGRTQSLLYQLWLLKMTGEIQLVPIYVDSPMAINATDLMSAHMDDHRLQPLACHEAFSMATYVRDTDGSKMLSASRMPKVIISASGMATGGRVLHHIKAFGRDPRNTILFAGFQAPGTRGRALVDGVRDVKIHGDWIEIRAEIADLTMLSAHADSNELLRWVSGFTSPPKKTFVVHGEPASSAALRDRVEAELGWSCVIPKMGDVFEFDHSATRLT